MKKLLFLSLIIVAAATSCKKEGTAKPITPVVGPITGTWQLVAARGGLTGGFIPIPDIYTAYTFKADSTYAYTLSNNGGTFHVGQVKSVITGQMQADISFSDPNAGGGLITLKNDTLTISTNHADPYIGIYVREIFFPTN